MSIIMTARWAYVTHSTVCVHFLVTEEEWGQDRSFLTDRGTRQSWEHMGLLLQWPAHYKIIINHGNTIIISITWERREAEERGEERQMQWLHGRWDAWKRNPTEKNKNKKLSIFSFFVFPQTRVQHWNRHGGRDVKKQKRWQRWGETETEREEKQQ